MELRKMRLSTSDVAGKKRGSGTNDIFEKCRNFTRPGDLQSAGLYMYFEVFGDREGCGPGEVRIGKRKVLRTTSTRPFSPTKTHPPTRSPGGISRRTVTPEAERKAIAFGAPSGIGQSSTGPVWSAPRPHWIWSTPCAPQLVISPPE